MLIEVWEWRGAIYGQVMLRMLFQRLLFVGFRVARFGLSSVWRPTNFLGNPGQHLTVLPNFLHEKFLRMITPTTECQMLRFFGMEWEWTKGRTFTVRKLLVEAGFGALLTSLSVGLLLKIALDILYLLTASIWHCFYSGDFPLWMVGAGRNRQIVGANCSNSPALRDSFFTGLGSNRFWSRRSVRYWIVLIGTSLFAR